MAIKYVDKNGLTYFYGKLENRYATKNAVGSPLVASTAAGMTDTSKVYVYVGSETGYTSGNWYYYNGSAWTSGGVYNSTAFQSDTTLSVSGAAADAKTAGDEISDLKSADRANRRGIINGTFTDVSAYTNNLTIGNVNRATGSNINSDLSSAKTNYLQMDGKFIALDTDDYQYSVVYCHSNSNGSGNVYFDTPYVYGKTPTALTAESAPYCKVVFKKDGTSDLTNYLEDLYSHIKVLSNTKIYIDDTLTVSGEAADADVVGDKFREVTEPRTNLFFVDVNNIPHISDDFSVTVADDGTVTIDGSVTGTTIIPIMGSVAGDYSGTVANTNIASGTYCAKLETISGEHTVENSFSLRYVPVGTTFTYNNSTRWVNDSYSEVVETLANNALLCLAINGAISFDDYTFRVQIEKGYEVGYYHNGGTTGIDFESREEEQSMQKSIGFVSDKKSESIQEKIYADGKAAVASLNKANGRLLNFAYITDTHVFPEPQNKFYSCRNNIDLFVKAMEISDFGVHGGDVTESGDMTRYGSTEIYVSHDNNIVNSTIAFRAFNRINKPIYVCHGNHDCNNYPHTEEQSVESVSGSEFNMLTSGLKKSVETPNNYYFVDYDEYKIRIIVLDSWVDPNGYAERDYKEAQANWLKYTAFDFSQKLDASEWGVLLFDHTGNPAVTGGTGLTTIISNFRANSNIPIIAWIHGHSHEDEYRDVLKEGSTVNINVIGVDQSFLKTVNGTTTDGTIGSKSEYCVDIFSVDKTNHVLYETRLGRGSSRSYHFGVGNSDNYEIT